jgi:transposase
MRGVFAASDIGGDRAASMYTIVQTAIRNGLNPEAYVHGTFARIADGNSIGRIDELMPWYRRSHHTGVAS